MKLHAKKCLIIHAHWPIQNQNQSVILLFISNLRLHDLLRIQEPNFFYTKFYIKLERQRVTVPHCGGCWRLGESWSPTCVWDRQGSPSLCCPKHLPARTPTRQSPPAECSLGGEYFHYVTRNKREKMEEKWTKFGNGSQKGYKVARDRSRIFHGTIEGPLPKAVKDQ